LNPQEGRTLVMTWPKGVITPPSAIKRLGWLLMDNLGLLLGGLGLLGSVIYLLFAWSRYGRDPDAGVIFPHYEPPDGYSPASARYVMRMGYDNKTLSAALINLAVKGYLTIDNTDDEYVVKKLVLAADATPPEMAPGEWALFETLFASGRTIELDNKNHKLISSARKAHRRALRADYLNIYFRKNSGLLLPSGAGLLVLGLIVLVSESFTPATIVLFAVAFSIHGLFALLLRRPSDKGRKLMDRLEGFKLYLEVAEKDDLNLRNPPDMTPRLFESYLPFAIALGVEQAWAEQFTSVFAALNGGQSAYRPTWYHGRFQPSRMGDFASDVGSGFNSAISSAATAPGSSSGGGGGGSVGGGGGGGGGGGW
jgi:uncharacterized membrane protein YgcG